MQNNSYAIRLHSLLIVYIIRNCFRLVLWHMSSPLHVQQFIGWFTNSNEANFWAAQFLGGKFHLFIHWCVDVHLSTPSFRFAVHHDGLCKWDAIHNSICIIQRFCYRFVRWLDAPQIFIRFRFCWISDANRKSRWISNTCYSLRVIHFVAHFNALYSLDIPFEIFLEFHNSIVCDKLSTYSIKIVFHDFIIRK